MIYPPNLSSTQPAFVPSGSYTINFTLPSYVAYNDIGHVQVRVVQQANNQSIGNTSLYPDGTIYKNMPDFNVSGVYGIEIYDSDLSIPWQAGTVYKVQVRFGTSALWGSVTSFATWKRENINNFSEWSNVMVIKAISEPEITIKNSSVTSVDNIDTTQYQRTITPLFEGSFKYGENDPSNEAADKFEFTLYDSDGNKIKSSGLLQYQGAGSIQYRFKEVLTADESYTVTLTVQTVNGYQGEAEPYKFTVKPLELETLTGIDFYGYDSDFVYGQENGCVKLYLTADNNLSGNYVITRASEVDDFLVWEDIKYLFFHNSAVNNQLVFSDFTIESGVQYKYAIQRENDKGLRSSPYYSRRYESPETRETENETINPTYEFHFEYSYLYRDGVQLRLQFNQKMNTFKHTVLRNKQDTLGDRYPHLTANGYAYYAEFPLSGLITLHMDEDSTFFTYNNGLYFGDELIAPARKFDLSEGDRDYCEEGTDGTTVLSAAARIDTNLTHPNIYIERKVREKVEEWLNTFDYKLYKSPTEGNIVVGLLNVQLQPKMELGRMVMEFTATAYEIAENTIEKLDEVGIITIGSRSSYSLSGTTTSFGQVNEVYNGMENQDDLLKIIKSQQAEDLSDGYEYSLDSVSAIWVDKYPQMDIDAEVNSQPSLRKKAAQKLEQRNQRRLSLRK